MAIPLTNKKIKRQNTICGCCTSYSAVVCVSLHAVISTMLLPLTVRGPIGGQYGLLKSGPDVIMNLSVDLPLWIEFFLISPLFLVHLMGCIFVIKQWSFGIFVYILFRIAETPMYVYWLPNVFDECIKSHTMSQSSLEWYCSISMFIQLYSVFVLLGSMVTQKIKLPKQSSGHHV